MRVLTRAVACPDCGKSSILSVHRLLPVAGANTLAFQLWCPDGHQPTRLRLSQMWLHTSGHSGPTPRPTPADDLQRGRAIWSAALATPEDAYVDHGPGKTRARQASTTRATLAVQDRVALSHTVDLFDGETLIATLPGRTRPPGDYYVVDGRAFQVLSDLGPLPDGEGSAWRVWVAPVDGRGALWCRWCRRGQAR